jgi:uncharacterized protein
MAGCGDDLAEGYAMTRVSHRKFMKLGLLGVLGSAFAGGAAYAYAHNVEPDMIEMKPVALRLPRLHPAFDGYKLAQFSDIHLGTGMTAERLMRIVQMINAVEPDAVAITGDFVTDGDVAPFAEVLINTLGQLRPKDVAVAVLGNHDHWTCANEVRAVIRQCGLFDISNDVLTIHREEAVFHLAGVDDHCWRRDRLDLVLRKLPEQGTAVLLAHEPDFAKISAPTGRFDLQISGHTHGGQVVLPFINRPLIVPRYGRKYPLGQYQVEKMIQYTNRGVGMIPPAVRFNCRPEITLFTLRTTTV